MKNAIYTCVTGNYDKVKNPKVVADNWDYILYTDNKNIKSDVWKVKYLDKNEFKGLNNTKKARKVKVLVNKFMAEYDITIWVDSNIEILENPENFVNKYKKNNDIVTIEHPARNCIYEEMIAVFYSNRDMDYQTLYNQMRRYSQDDYPRENGLAETNVMLRVKNDKVNKIMDKWWDEIKEYSKRDQLSFNYSLWKVNNGTKVEYINAKIRNQYFLWTPKHDNAPKNRK